MAEPPPAYDHGYPPPQQQPYNPGYPQPQQQPYYDHPRQAAYHDAAPQGGPGYHGYPPASYPKGQYGQQPRQAPKQPPPHYRRPPPPRVPASKSISVHVCIHNVLHHYLCIMYLSDEYFVTSVCYIASYLHGYYLMNYTEVTQSISS